MWVTRRPNKEALKRFVQEEDGATGTIFVAFLCMIMLLLTGAAIDVMRYESYRTEMQHVLDRAVLAAADMDQKGDPTEVANDYIDTAGVGPALSNVTVEEGLNFRTVTATADTTINTIFMRLMGIDDLDAAALSTAEEKISKVEISMVLDISGSMGSNSKIQNLRDAGREFVDTVIQSGSDDPDQTTVSIVPYNATVNLGPTVSQYFNLENSHNYSNCAIFSDSQFDTVGITGGQELKRLAHFDLYSSSESTTEISNPWCPDDNYGSIMVHSSNATALKNHIDSLGAGGNTAIDLGMKWGAALLHPDMRPVVAEMIEDDVVADTAVQRPFDMDDSEAMKIVVLMTDGKNTTQYDLKQQFKYGMSDVWIDERGNSNPSDDRFSVLVDDNSGSSNDEYYWVRYDGSSWSYRYRNYPDGGSSARRMSHAEVYARFGVKGAAKKFWERPKWDGHISSSTYSNIYYGYTSIVNGSSADDRLHDICEAAKEQGIVVFSIAFEAPTEGQEALLDCASSPSHYFAVEGIEITETFHAIARQINNLRLIQ